MDLVGVIYVGLCVCVYVCMRKYVCVRLCEYECWRIRVCVILVIKKRL